MAYINPGRFIEPYLKPYGKQTVKHIPGIQQERRARDRLESLKPVWAEQVAESQQNQQIQRDAQARLNALSGISPEQLQPFIGGGQDADTAMKLIMAGKAKLGALSPDKALTPAWKSRIVRDPATGKLINETFNANDPNAQLKTEIPTKKVKIHGRWKDVDLDTARYIEDQNMENVRADQKRTEDIAEKNKQTEIKYLTEEIDKASRRGDQSWLSMCEQRLADIVDIPTTGKTRDPKIDEARSILMEARQELARYEKIAASQDPADMGAQLAPTSMPEIPPEQFLPLPPKKEPKLPKKPTFAENRMREKYATNAENVILSNNEDTGEPNIENPAIISFADMFNRYSPKSYVYIWQEEYEKTTKRKLLWDKKETISGKLVKTELPVINGEKVTKQHIWDTMKEEDMTFNEVLKLIGVLK